MTHRFSPAKVVAIQGVDRIPMSKAYFFLGYSEVQEVSGNGIEWKRTFFLQRFQEKNVAISDDEVDSAAVSLVEPQLLQEKYDLRRVVSGGSGPDMKKISQKNDFPTCRIKRPDEIR